ncbi:transcriptional regulator, LysR family [Azospirillum oryzae]|uniref:Transcriptional regulator, LysR family n=1 Tax=Azospirillum oryzae TaxID=286727 RepID=A0A1X7EH18_9PROT|nr:LysR family transcriptional regulator [Azospirillum oryzae]SMF33850.1 transcriptional regulator, LysR family [Azospirillum oryzae]
MNLAALDMNLLVVFDALMEERNVTRAGRRVGLTQPAVSNALSRLRLLLKDQLFIRTPAGMQPTARALEIAGPVQQALAQIKDALEPSWFDPATAELSFALAAGDYIGSTLLPPLTELLRDRAPGVRLRVLPANTLDLMHFLDNGECDMAIGFFDTIPERLDAMPLWAESVSLVARWDHPLASGPMSLERLAEAPHILISQTGQEDDGSSDGYLLSHGLRRQVMTRSHLALRRSLEERGLRLRVALTVPYYSAVLPIVMQSDLVTLLPHRVALSLHRLAGVAVRDLPCPLEAVQIQGLWHRQVTARASHTWLRRLVAEAAQRMTGQTLSPGRLAS